MQQKANSELRSRMFVLRHQKTRLYVLKLRIVTLWLAGSMQYKYLRLTQVIIHCITTC